MSLPPQQPAPHQATAAGTLSNSIMAGNNAHTMPPLPGSTPNDADNTAATNSLTDQRGMPRVLSGGHAGIPIVKIDAVY